MRVKRGVTAHRRHKKVIDATKGYRMSRHLLYSVAHQAMMHAGQYSYQHRRKRGGDFRRLWIARINAAVRNRELTYNEFTHLLGLKSVQLNRQILAELAVTFPETFTRVVDFVKR